jgi:hypothetical protein
MRVFFILVQWIRRLRKISLKMSHLSHGFNSMKKDNSASNEMLSDQQVGEYKFAKVAETENSLQESYTEY